MSIIVKGHVRVERDGVVIYEARNRVVDAGLALIATVFTATGVPTRIKAIAFGTNTQTPTATQVKLSGVEAGRRAVVTSHNGPLIRYDATITGVNKTLREFGLFNSTGATGGTMLARWLSTPIVMTTGASLSVSWAIQFGT